MVPNKMHFISFIFFIYPLPIGDAEIDGHSNFCLKSMKCRFVMNICCIYTAIGKRCKLYKDPHIKLLSDDDEAAILNSHNKLRNEIAGGKSLREDLKGILAADMQVLSYSRQLTYTASCWAKQCVIGMSRCRRIELGDVGEAFYVERTLDEAEDMALVAKRMLDDFPLKILHKHANISTAEIDSLRFLRGDQDEPYRQFLQVLWAKANRLGCFRIFFDNENQKYRNLLLVCHYFSEADEIGKPVFIRGQPCSKCPKALKCNTLYSNLCGTIRNPDDDPWEGPDLASRNSFNKLVFFGLILILRSI